MLNSNILVCAYPYTKVTFCISQLTAEASPTKARAGGTGHPVTTQKTLMMWLGLGKYRGSLVNFRYREKVVKFGKKMGKFDQLSLIEVWHKIYLDTVTDLDQEMI